MAAPKRGLDEFLGDILEAIDDIRDFTRGMDAAMFVDLPDTDKKTFRAVKDALGQIGEAVKSVPADVRGRHPHIDWRGLAGMRDRLVHSYFSVNLASVWKTITTELDELRQAVEMELARPAPPPP